MKDVLMCVGFFPQEKILSLLQTSGSYAGVIDKIDGDGHFSILWI